ncbi:CD151 antigen [Solenopsis invicta]|uniref:CD151 antigen n=1 Tax=Solenopsis invicta TaxID=13686 RepID=UPI000E33D6A8|nr:CD151 antigen [Solenopsis invicta]
MDNCGRCIKYLLLAINLVTLIVATIVTIASVWGLVGQSSWLKKIENIGLGIVFYVLLIAGIIVMCIAIFGIVAALREVKCMLKTYAVFMFLMFVGEIIHDVKRQHSSNKKGIKLLEEEMENSLQFYNDDNIIRNFWDVTQSTYQCCGVDNWKDWETHGFEVPNSCCKSDQLLDCNADQYTKNISKLYAEGCINKITSLIQHLTNIINGFTITLLCLLFLGMVLSFALLYAL